jgi:hypothetical protein
MRNQSSEEKQAILAAFKTDYMDPLMAETEANGDMLGAYLFRGVALSIELSVEGLVAAQRDLWPRLQKLQPAEAAKPKSIAVRSWHRGHDGQGIGS